MSSNPMSSRALVPSGLEFEEAGDIEGLLSGNFRTPSRNSSTSTSAATPAATSTTPTSRSAKKFKFRRPASTNRVSIDTRTASSAFNRPLSTPRGEEPLILDVSTPTVHHTTSSTTTRPEPFPSSVADVLPRKKAKRENSQRIFLITYSRANKVRFPRVIHSKSLLWRHSTNAVRGRRRWISGWLLTFLSHVRSGVLAAHRLRIPRAA